MRRRLRKAYATIQDRDNEIAELEVRLGEWCDYAGELRQERINLEEAIASVLTDNAGGPAFRPGIDAAGILHAALGEIDDE